MTRTGNGEPTAPRATLPTGTDQPGDSACWAHRVCQQCGRLADDERPQICALCGAVFPTD